MKLLQLFKGNEPGYASVTGQSKIDIMSQTTQVLFEVKNCN